jgi:hypothetical protein
MLKCGAAGGICYKAMQEVRFEPHPDGRRVKNIE